MSKRKPSGRPARAAAKPRGSDPGRRKPQDRREEPSEKADSKQAAWHAGIRETVESVAIAFILAFLFRTFEAEAFVIPTGSMAPTLMGRHKDLVCPKCGCDYQVSASDEVDRLSSAYRGPAYRIVNGTCPMCRYTMDLDADNPKGTKYPSFKGDRILVGKFFYQFSPPQRWDVAVFKFPGGSATNYIKRLVGQPNETLRISHGDIFVKPADGEEFTIARKPAEKLMAVLQPVFDNDVTPRLLEHGWQARWQPQPGGDAAAAGGWQPSADFSTFETAGDGPQEAWLRYEHRVPTFGQWQALEGGRLPPGEPPPQLISDFCAYNTGWQNTGVVAQAYAYGEPWRTADVVRRLSAEAECDVCGVHWVGDLALRCTLEAKSDAGEAIFELVEGGRRLSCRIDVATGKATLGIIGLDAYQPTGETAVRGDGQPHEILFANVDDQLRLLVDGCEVEFDAPTTYDPLGNTRPTEDDFSPVGIGTRGAALAVSHLKIFRDLYYIAARAHDGSSISDFRVPKPPYLVLTDPDHWDVFDETNMKEVEFQLAADQFLALGDNSAKSQDSRLWGTPRPDVDEYFVRRELLIGKALFIYWPDTHHKVPLPFWPYRFPFFPNIPDMGFVR